MLPGLPRLGRLFWGGRVPARRLVRVRPGIITIFIVARGGRGRHREGVGGGREGVATPPQLVRPCPRELVGLFAAVAEIEPSERFLLFARLKHVPGSARRSVTSGLTAFGVMFQEHLN